MKKITWPKIKFGLLLAIIITCLGISIYWRTIGFDFEFSRFAQSYYAPLLFVLFYITISFIPIPVPIMFIGGFFFPATKAVVLTLIATVIFSTVSFYLARWLGRDYFGEIENKYPKLKSFNEKLIEEPFMTILMMRLFFVIPGEIINTYAGLIKIRYRDFITATTIASFPLILACIGVIRSQINHDYDSLLLSIAVLVILIVIPLWHNFGFKIKSKN